MSIKLNSVNIDRKKPIRINKPLNKLNIISEKINFDSLRSMNKDILIQELINKSNDENFIEQLYKEAPDLLNIYIYEKWNNKIRELVKVVNYNNLQEFYLSKMNSDRILNDKILLYSIIPSNYMKEYLDREFDNLQGFIITRDLPEESYSTLFDSSAFSIYNAE